MPCRISQRRWVLMMCSIGREQVKIFLVAKERDVRGVLALMEQGVDPNTTCPEKNYTPLIAAVFNQVTAKCYVHRSYTVALDLLIIIETGFSDSHSLVLVYIILRDQLYLLNAGNMDAIIMKHVSCFTIRSVNSIV